MVVSLCTAPNKVQRAHQAHLLALDRIESCQQIFFWKEEYEWLTVKEVLRINIHGNPRYDQCLGRAGSLLDGGGLDR